jgi:hypothetical protein
MKIRVLLIFISILAAGCSAKPASTIDYFVANVADGDIRRANNLLDRQRINSDLIRQAINESGLDHNFMKTNAEKTIKQANDIAKQKVWSILDDEVKKGKNSVLASIEILRESIDNKHNASVVVQFSNGKQTTLRLSTENGKWLITGLDLNIFRQIAANPSFDANQIKSIGEFVGKGQDDRFYALIGTELWKLVGGDYGTLINNMSVSDGIRKKGRYITVCGNAPLSGGSDEGIVVIDVKTGIMSAAIMENRQVSRFSNIKNEEDYPDLIKSWNKE